MSLSAARAMADVLTQCQLTDRNLRGWREHRWSLLALIAMGRTHKRIQLPVAEELKQAVKNLMKDRREKA